MTRASVVQTTENLMDQPRTAQGAELITASTRLSVVRFADSIPESWANGAGVTRVLAAGSLPGSPADFDWRLSIASVISGPFSALPGVDRILTLVEGPTLSLTVDGHQHEVAPCRPLTFRGESVTVCQTTGPASALNVMTRRAVCSATVTVRIGSGVVAAPLGCLTYLVALAGTVSVRFRDGHTTGLQMFDAVRQATAATVSAANGGRFAVIRIRQRH